MKSRKFVKVLASAQAFHLCISRLHCSWNTRKPWINKYLLETLFEFLKNRERKWTSRALGCPAPTKFNVWEEEVKSAKGTEKEWPMGLDKKAREGVQHLEVRSRE